MFLELKKTPLNEVHRASGGRMVPFAGWEMPVQYKGLIEEHLTVRSSAGLFDVSHMGEIEVSGPKAHAFVQRVTTNDVDRVADGQCQYTLLCHPDGGVVDDTIVYRFGDARFLFCVNASNADKVYDWFNKNNAEGALIEDLSANYAQIALQGPNAPDVLGPLLDIKTTGIKHFHFVMAIVAGAEAMVSRTGYTGEDGFEIYLEPNDAAKVWGAILEVGGPYGVAPIGLGARDTLRLEMGYPLYGHELSERLTPIEAGLRKYVRLDKKEFIGKDALKRQSEHGVDKTLIGFKMTDPGIPRENYEIRCNGKKSGWVTSGTMSPSLRTGIGMGYVDAGGKGGNTPFDAGLEIVIRERLAKANVCTPPFYSMKSAVGVK